MEDRLSFGILLTLVAALVAGVVVLVMNFFLDFTPTELPATRVALQPGVAQAPLIFNPPRPETAPDSIRDAVMLGYDILLHTGKNVPAYVGNQLDCSDCHFDAGLAEDGLALVGVAAVFPRFDRRIGRPIDLIEQTNLCFTHAENGKPLPPDGKEMRAILAYYQWISKGIPIYAEPPWLGLKPLAETGAPPVAAKGREIFVRECAMCHGEDGEGSDIAPPLWGPESFTDGGGMAHPPLLGAFVHRFMPKDNAHLSPEQALAVAAFIDSRPRPHFTP